MAFITFIAAFLLQVVAATTESCVCLPTSLTPSYWGCVLPVGLDKVVFPNSTGYQESADTYFAQQQGQLTPYCYVKPTSAEDVSKAIKCLALLNLANNHCPFAVRGAGHHTVVGISNVNDGVTIDLGNMNNTDISQDRTTAKIGSGARWGSVYRTLVTQGLAVLGGRESDIGVGGFITGGGISYFGAQYGFGCDMVENFEIVLANGQITNANSNQNSDLFVALKGGSSNFGIVTRFDLKTFQLGDYFGGATYYFGSETPALLDAFHAVVANPNFDTKTGIILTAVYAPKQGAITTATLSYAEPVENPPVFVNFTTVIPPISDTLAISNLSFFADQLGANQIAGLRETSITATVKLNLSLLQQIYGLWNGTILAISAAPNLVYAMTFQPLAVNMLATGTLQGGNSLGLTAADGPLIVLTLTVAYTDSSFDANILYVTRGLFAKIRALASESNDLHPWIYYNYADSKQPVIASYGAANRAKLKAVSKMVDPKGLFQTVQPGGFKL